MRSHGLYKAVCGRFLGADAMQCVVERSVREIGKADLARCDRQIEEGFRKRMRGSGL